MENACARQLCTINNRFYRANAASFSQTRAQAWPGWERVCAELERADIGAPAGAHAGSPSEDASALILDVACGNLRFERFCAKRWGAGATRFLAVDDCAPLASAPLEHMPQVRFSALDVVSWLIDEAEAKAAGGDGFCFSGALSQEGADAAMCFGFFHHVPSERLRARLLAELVRSVRPGGVVAASFWRFMDDERLARKALADDKRARAHFPPELIGALEEGDHLLGWQKRPGAFRYCHSFSDAELDCLVASAAGRARLVCSFGADGRSGALNRYLVFRRL